MLHCSDQQYYTKYCNKKKQPKTTHYAANIVISASSCIFLYPVCTSVWLCPFMKQ